MRSNIERHFTDDSEKYPSIEELETTFGLYRNVNVREIKEKAIYKEQAEKLNNLCKDTIEDLLGLRPPYNTKLLFLPEANEKVGAVYSSMYETVFIYLDDKEMNSMENGRFHVDVIEKTLHELGHSFSFKEIHHSKPPENANGNVLSKIEQYGFAQLFPSLKNEADVKPIGVFLEEVFAYTLQDQSLGLIENRYNIVRSGRFKQVEVANEIVEYIAGGVNLSKLELLKYMAHVKSNPLEYEQDFRQLLEKSFGNEFYDMLLTLDIEKGKIMESLKNGFNNIKNYRSNITHMTQKEI